MSTTSQPLEAQWSARRRLVLRVCGIGALLAVGLLLAGGGSLIAARYGTPAMRQAVLYDWINQRTPLSWLQKTVLRSLLYKEVGDPDVVGTAVAALNAHIQEDEEETVRHLVYVAFTTRNPSDRRVALSGLMQVSPIHKHIATAVFLYYLKHSNPTQNKDEALNVAFCVSGLARASYRDALPAIAQFTNSTSKYLSWSAQEAVIKLSASQPSH